VYFTETSPSVIEPMCTFIRKQLSARQLAAVLVVLALGRAAFAQEAPKEPNWTTIRQTTLQSLDRRTVEQWVEFQINQLLTIEDSEVVEKAGAAFYANMVKQYSARNASKEFQDGLARIVSAEFAKDYKPSTADAKLPQPLGVALVLMVLRDFGHPSALPCFKAALTDPKAGPRYVAAKGLAAIRQAISEDDWTALLSILQQAGTKERNPVALRAFYQALFVDTANRVDGAIQTLLKILELRLLACEQNGKLPMEVNGQAAMWLAGRAGRINNQATQNQIVRQIGRLLADAVYTYLNEELEEAQQEQIEKLIRITEGQLQKAVKVRMPNATGFPKPTVIAAVLASGDDRDQKAVTTALAQWIGSAEKEGLLNQNPFSFPRQLGIQRQTKAPATAPAEEQ